MKRLAALGGAAIMVVAVAACSSHDRIVLTDFEPISETEFVYGASAPVDYPESSPSAEATRMEWLEHYLAGNGLCPHGYEIVERKAIYKYTGLLGDVYKLIYRGKCTERETNDVFEEEA